MKLSILGVVLCIALASCYKYQPKRPTLKCDGTNYFPEEHICCGGKLFSVRTYKCVYDAAVKTYQPKSYHPRKIHRHDEQEDTLSYQPRYYKPTPTEAPTTTPEPTTTEAPTTTPEPTTTEAPTTTPEPTTTEAPKRNNYNDDYNRPYRRPKYYKPTSTEAPTTTLEPTTTEAQKRYNYDDDYSISYRRPRYYKPTTTEAPTTTPEPTTTEAPTTTPEPTTTEAQKRYTYDDDYSGSYRRPRYYKPTTTEEPTTTPEPTTTEAPTTTQEPTTTEAPKRYTYDDDYNGSYRRPRFYHRRPRPYGRPSYYNRDPKHYDEQEDGYYRPPTTTPEPRPTLKCNGVNYFEGEHICCGGKLVSVRTYKCVYGVPVKRNSYKSRYH